VSSLIGIRPPSPPSQARTEPPYIHKSFFTSQFYVPPPSCIVPLFRDLRSLLTQHFPPPVSRLRRFRLAPRGSQLRRFSFMRSRIITPLFLLPRLNSPPSSKDRQPPCSFRYDLAALEDRLPFFFPASLHTNYRALLRSFSSKFAGFSLPPPPPDKGFFLSATSFPGNFPPHIFRPSYPAHGHKRSYPLFFHFPSRCPRLSLRSSFATRRFFPDPTGNDFLFSLRRAPLILAGAQLAASRCRPPFFSGLFSAQTDPAL